MSPAAGGAAGGLRATRSPEYRHVVQRELPRADGHPFSRTHGAPRVLVDEVVGLPGNEVVALLHHRDAGRPARAVLTGDRRRLLQARLELGGLVGIQDDEAQLEEAAVA